ncbi:hypothetical protein HY489_03420 [Candidatus Woesearchaeota archaeon]|nr:hypothetical protein [Candidatus Woesearchaeota archaeon]
MAEEVQCTTKKWGSSIGIVIPSDVVKKEHIKPNEQISILIRRVPLAKELWGIGLVRDKRSTQEIKDELRKGW